MKQQSKAWIFVSHSTKDKTVSDAVCAALENGGIRCWVAPRDVQPGRSFAGEITRAIQESKIMVLIFSAHSNNSEQVLREVQLVQRQHAVHHHAATWPGDARPRSRPAEPAREGRRGAVHGSQHVHRDQGRGQGRDAALRRADGSICRP